MNAADSSCRTWMNRMRSWRVRSASMIPLMPSPGRPKTTSTSQSSKVSINTSAAVSAMLPSSRASGPERLLHRGCQRRCAAGADEAEVGAPGDENGVRVGTRIDARAHERRDAGLMTDAIAQRDGGELGRRIGPGGETHEVATAALQ